MRAAIYVRVSTEDQVEKFGLAVQQERCEAMARVKGWEVVAMFSDEGLSGVLDVTDRPGLSNLMEAANNGSVDAVIVAALDRIGRQTRIVLSIAEWLARLKVDLLSCRENLDTSTPSGQFVLTMFAGLAQLEKDTIRERTMSGIVASVKDGNVHIGGSNAPYGYDVGKVNGKRTLIVNDVEAEIVRFMFERVADGGTIHSLAAWLTERGTPKPAKGKNHRRTTKRKSWSIGTIAGILSNEVYVGRWYYRKTKREKQPDDTVKNVPRPRNEWLEVKVPAIVDEATFTAVQERRKLNKAQMGGRRTHDYALSGMLTCGHCLDIGMTGISRHEKTKTMGERVYSYYVCNRRHNRKRFGGLKCELPPISTSALEATVAGWVIDIVLSPQRLREAWRNHRDESLAEMEPLVDMVEANENKVIQLRQERQRLIDAYAAGVLSLDDIAVKKTDIERLISEYENAIRTLKEDISAQVPGEAEFETMEEFAHELSLGAQEVIDDPAALHTLYRLLNMRVVVTHEENNQWADIACYLGKKKLSTVSTTPRCIDNDTAI